LEILTTPFPIAPGEKSLSYKSAYCLCIVFVIGNYAPILNLTPLPPNKDNFSWGRKFPGGNFSGKILYHENLEEFQ